MPFTSWIKVLDTARVFVSMSDGFSNTFSGNCGSCWAIGTGGSLADRLCIASNASMVRSVLIVSLSIACLPKLGTCTALIYVPFLAQILEGGASYQEILGCDKIPPNKACLGGVPRTVWDWAQAFSVASNKCFKYIAGDRWNEPSCIEYLLNSGPSHPHCDRKYSPAPCVLRPRS